MKIDKTSGVDALGRRSGETAAAPRRPIDRVSIEEQKKVREMAAAAAEAAQSARATELAELKAQIEEGTYRIDSGLIAERILRDAEVRAAIRALLS